MIKANKNKKEINSEEKLQQKMVNAVKKDKKKAKRNNFKKKIKSIDFSNLSEEDLENLEGLEEEYYE